MSGWVYFAQDKATGLVKIGWAKSDPDSRIASFQTGCPGEIEFLCAEGGGRDLEAAYHKVFRSVRVRGEWFWPIPLIMEFAGYRDRGRYPDETMDEIRERFCNGKILPEPE